MGPAAPFEPLQAAMFFRLGKRKEIDSSSQTLGVAGVRLVQAAGTTLHHFARLYIATVAKLFEWTVSALERGTVKGQWPYLAFIILTAAALAFNDQTPIEANHVNS